jgi:hypothetical protein
MNKFSIDLRDLTQQGQRKVIRRRLSIGKKEYVTISEAYLTYFGELTQDVRVGGKNYSSTVMWECHSAAFRNESSYLQFDYFRKKEQVRMIKEALSGLLNQDVEVKRVMVGEPYTEEGEAKQEVTIVSIGRLWTVIWNCNEVCFDVTKKDIELMP